MQRECIDILELQSLLKEGLDEIFPTSLWISAEIASVQLRTNGHCYLELCRSVQDRVVARAKATIWKSKYLPLISYFIEATGDVLKAGMEIMARVQVSYSEIYGLSLNIEELEPAYTLGAAEIRRRQTMEKLREQGLLDLQKHLPIAALPYRLAVISAHDAAGYEDFSHQLLSNPYGFAFEIDLFEATMQGEAAPESISDALAAVESSEFSYDAVLIMRGGGSSLDLACFDDFALCFAIANCPIPVYTAIGHDRDTHAADAVAYDYVKTPTALAELFIDAIAAEDERISACSTRLRLAFSSKLSAMSAALDVLASRIKAADPRNLLSRGYTLVVDSRGVVLKKAEGIKSGDKLKIMFNDASIDTIVQ